MGLKEQISEVKEEVKKVKEQSFAMDLLKDYKHQNKRQFIIILVILTMWFATIGYLVYVLNDIGVIEETTQEVMQENESGNNNFIGNNGDITNGKTESKNH